MQEQQQDLATRAAALLEQGLNDGAIDLLRTPGPTNDAELCALTARAFYQRGDTKGDVYSSHYFAGRARELGCTDPGVVAIQAIGAFRKEQFEETAELFAGFASEQSPHATQFVYGLALCRVGRAADALPWLERALALDAGNAQYGEAVGQAKAAAEAGEAPLGIRRTPNMYHTLTDELLAGDALEVDTPYPHNAVSKLRGLGTTPKDFHWLAANIPCQEACPAHTDIPAYLQAIFRGDYDRAYRINLWHNVFPAVLGRVCARPCESECRHGWEDLGDPVGICFSKRSAADLRDGDPVVLDALYPSTGKKVAVIGAGASGLTAARQLALLGHSVVVYEKHSRPGGMMNQGIPEFRLPREIIDREIDQIRQQGVEIKCNTVIGRDITMAQLLADNDALVMAAGALRPNILPLPGKELGGIRHGLGFLFDVNDKGSAPVGKQVIVIGGGFTAMDCARTAFRLESDNVRVMYRRSQNEMFITPGELEELGHEGIPMEFMVSPVAYLGDEQGNVKAMRFIRTELGEPDDSGRRRPVDIPGSEFEVDCDTVLLATGQFPETSWIGSALGEALVGEDQWLQSGPEATTSKAQVFAAGDFAQGASSLIEAIGHAKDCARKVDLFLMGEERLHDAALVRDAEATGRIREMDAVDRQQMPSIPVAQRSLSAEVETGYDAPLAIDETQRCYLCHHKYEIDSDKCIFCDWCVKAKPRPDCIVKIRDLEVDDEGRIQGFERASGSEDTRLIWINQEDCIRCNACRDACPVDCISLQTVSWRTAVVPGAVNDC